MIGKLKAIDLFCGCGGISAGLRGAGFEVLAGVDVEPNYISTFSHNFSRSKSFQLDLAAVQPDEFMRLADIEEGEVDLLAGGAPCQGFSKNVPRKNRCLEDPRNELIKIFLNYCQELKPRFVLMEKVAEMSIAAMEPGSPYEIVYGSDSSCLEELRRLMVQQLGYEPAAVYQIGAAVAANSGPRVVGAAFTRKKESKTEK